MAFLRIKRKSTDRTAWHTVILRQWQVLIPVFQGDPMAPGKGRGWSSLWHMTEP